MFFQVYALHKWVPSSQHHGGPRGAFGEEIIKQKAYSTLRWLSKFHLRLISRSPVGNPGLPLCSRILCHSFCPWLSSMIAPTSLSSLPTPVTCWCPLVVITSSTTFGLCVE